MESAHSGRAVNAQGSFIFTTHGVFLEEARRYCPGRIRPPRPDRLHAAAVHLGDLRRELRAITNGMPDDPTNKETTAVLEDMEKLADRASGTLKDTIKEVAFANLERMKPAKEQDAAAIDEAQERIDVRSDMMESASGEL